MFRARVSHAAYRCYLREDRTWIGSRGQGSGNRLQTENIGQKELPSVIPEFCEAKYPGSNLSNLFERDPGSAFSEFRDDINQGENYFHVIPDIRFQRIPG